MFDVTFLAGDVVYRYVVEAVVSEVRYESLERVTEKGSFEIFERNAENDDAYSFNDGFFGESDHVAYVAKSTRSNRLFLGSAVAQNVVELEEAYGWFANTLELVGVESHAWSFAACVTEKRRVSPVCFRYPKAP